MRTNSTIRESLPCQGHRLLSVLALACCLGMAPVAGLTDPIAASPATMSARPAADRAGESVTLLPDGRWMLAGGAGEQGVSASIEVSDGTRKTAFPASLLHPRRGHTATVLPDGSVLILGGTGPDDRLVDTAEVIDPVAGTAREVVTPGITPRTEHTATLLTSGEVLIAGGRDVNGDALASVQLWDPISGRAAPSESELQAARYAHEAALLASGEGLLWGGRDSAGDLLTSKEIYDPSTRTVQSPAGDHDPRLTTPWPNQPLLMDTVPVDGSADVPLETVIGARFSKPVPVTSLNEKTVTLVGPAGPVAGSVVGAEGGMLAFFKPAVELLPATSYTLFVRGVSDASGSELPLSSVRFSTHRVLAPPASEVQAVPNARERPDTMSPSPEETRPAAALPPTKVQLTPPSTPPRPRDTLPPTREAMTEDWVPHAENRHGAWRVLGLAGDPPLSTESASTPLLSAPVGTTAIAGRVLRFNGLPLPGVRLSLGAVTTTTDGEGRFLLAPVDAGDQLVRVDGRSVVSGGRHYTEHYIHVSVSQGSTATFQDPIYLPRVDPATEVAISSPADHDIVLTHPAIPGLEVRIPKGAVIREADGTVVRSVSITPIPVDRAPYKSPVAFPVYFTLQPGGAYIDGDPSKAIKVTYPNYQGLRVGTSVEFWNYNPQASGWQVYGHGKVASDGQRVVADESVGFRQIMSFGFSLGRENNTPPATAPTPNGTCAGDPVDCSTGIFSHTVTDMAIKDVMPISVTRMYRTNDNQVRLFGVGANLSYAMVLYAPVSTGNAYLVRGDGSQITFVPAPVGSGPDVAWVAAGSPTEFDGAVIIENESVTMWDVKLRDGTIFRFSPDTDLLNCIIDPAGDQITITYQSNSVSGTNPPITQVTSPRGRYFRFFYDSYNRIVQAVDNTGRSTSYNYDPLGRLSSVVDADGYTESYGYDPTTNNMNLVTDKRGNKMVQNLFDANARVSQQTLADGAIWKFSYTLGSNGTVTQTTITDPRTYVRQETFNESGYATQIILAQGKPEQQTYSISRNGSNRPLLVTDTLGRETLYGYDGFGDLTSATFLYGTSNAVTYSLSYDPSFHQLTGVSDPLGHSTTATIDGNGNTLSVSDALGDTTHITYNHHGMPTSLVDPLGHTTLLGYSASDLVSVTDPLSRQTQFNNDALGRTRSAMDPLGNLTSYSYDAMDRLVAVTDAMNEVSSLAYDQNGNLQTSTDPRKVVQTYGYDSRNRLQTYQDPAGKTATYYYDGMGNVTSVVDRKNQTTSIQYDGINRPTLITFQDSSTIAITWDGGNRATVFADSLNGTISRTYDGLDRLTQESGPQGTVNVQYDAASRRLNMTATGQTMVNYTFDNANRLTQVAQGTTTLAFGYDVASRRTTVTLPNSIVGTYGFDSANELTGITYAVGSNQIGTLTYGYDLAGRRTNVGGTLAGFTPPAYVLTMAYDGTNRLVTRGGQSLSYDADGNLTALGTGTYTWNARNQMTATSVGSATFGYDAVGRRATMTNANGTRTTLYDGWNPATSNGVLLLASGNPDEIFAMVVPSATTSLLKDGVNSTVALTSGSGAITGNYYYSPYGDTAQTGPATTPYEFTGREQDAGTGLYNYRARYYLPETGRFVSEDPIGLAGGTNYYAYVHGNPVTYRDPLGLLDNPAQVYPWLPPPDPVSAFAFGAVAEASPGPMRGAVEAIGLVGYNSSSGWYAGAIGASGAEIGGKQNYYGDFVGREITTECRHWRKIILREFSWGPEIPFLAGLGLGGGRYSTADESGWFFFFSGGTAAMGDASFGFGFPTSSSHASPSCGCN